VQVLPEVHGAVHDDSANPALPSHRQRPAPGGRFIYADFRQSALMCIMPIMITAQKQDLK
jgi:hypothetical protein